MSPSLGFSPSLPAWDRAEQASLTLSAGLSSGFPGLDRLLPGGGWPTGGVTEIIARKGQSDPTELLLPALAPLSWESGWLAWVGAPHPPPKALLAAHGVDTSRVLWIRPQAGERVERLALRALEAGTCTALLVWLDGSERFPVTALQRAAQDANGTVFVLRPPAALAQPTAADLRVYVSTHSRSLGVEILECRGGAGTTLQLPSLRESTPAAVVPSPLPRATGYHRVPVRRQRPLLATEGV